MSVEFTPVGAEFVTTDRRVLTISQKGGAKLCP